MQAQDRDVRRYAVPVRGTIWGVNYNDRSERDIGARDGVPTVFGDYHDYFPSYEISTGVVYSPRVGANKICPIRILKPHYGELIECYVDMQITVNPSDSDLTLKLGIGKFVAGTYDRVLVYSDEEIDQAWRKMRGTDTPLQVADSRISGELINLLDALPKFGDQNYIEDAFVLVLAFNKIPSFDGTFKFNYLNIHTSVTGAI